MAEQESWYFEESRDFSSKICLLFIIEEDLDSVNLDGFDEDFGDIRSFLTMEEKDRFAADGIRSSITLFRAQENDIKGSCLSLG